MQEVERLFLDVMKAIASIIDAKDGYTHKHSERVAAFGVRLAHHLGFDADSRAVVELSGLLHDVGKIGVPDAILNKPGKLTEAEFKEMRLHPLHGARILSNIQSQKVVSLLPGVKYHHERWDGTGYPEGLKGEEIPLLGRVLGVADFLDALTSDRSYRKGLTLEEALQMVKDLEGQAFDPVVVKAAVELHEKGELALPSTPNPGMPAGMKPPKINRLRAVQHRQGLDKAAAASPAAIPLRERSSGGTSMRAFHVSARPPMRVERAAAHSFHHGEIRCEIGSTIRTRVDAFRFLVPGLVRSSRSFQQDCPIASFSSLTTNAATTIEVSAGNLVFAACARRTSKLRPNDL